MTDTKTTTKPTPAKKTTSRKAECRVPDCVRKPTTRGLCDAHWASRRGDADPKPTKSKG